MLYFNVKTEFVKTVWMATNDYSGSKTPKNKIIEPITMRIMTSIPFRPTETIPKSLKKIANISMQCERYLSVI